SDGGWSFPISAPARSMVSAPRLTTSATCFSELGLVTAGFEKMPVSAVPALVPIADSCRSYSDFDSLAVPPHAAKTANATSTAVPTPSRRIVRTVPYEGSPSARRYPCRRTFRPAVSGACRERTKEEPGADHADRQDLDGWNARGL